MAESLHNVYLTPARIRTFCPQERGPRVAWIRRTDPCAIYCATNSSATLIKVGLSHSPESRLRALRATHWRAQECARLAGLPEQTNPAMRLVQVWTFGNLHADIVRVLEDGAHHDLRNVAQHKGEWFALTPDEAIPIITKSVRHWLRTWRAIQRREHKQKS